MLKQDEELNVRELITDNSTSRPAEQMRHYINNNISEIKPRVLKNVQDIINNAPTCLMMLEEYKDYYDYFEVDKKLEGRKLMGSPDYIFIKKPDYLILDLKRSFSIFFGESNNLQIRMYMLALDEMLGEEEHYISGQLMYLRDDWIPPHIKLKAKHIKRIDKLKSEVRKLENDLEGFKSFKLNNPRTCKRLHCDYCR